MKEGFTHLFGTDTATADKVSQYADAHSTDLPAHITAYHARAQQAHHDSNMLSSNYQSKLHLLLANAIGAKRVLEIGVFLGYSAMLWAHAVGPDGVVTGLEYDPELAKLAGDAIAKEGIKNVEIIVGDGAKTLPQVSPSTPYDLVFIDADKTGYSNYLNILLANSQPGNARRLLRPGALIIADNVLRRGYVADPDRPDNVQRDPGDKKRWELHIEAVQKFNDQVVKEKRLESFLMPLWDGVTIMRLVD